MKRRDAYFAFKRRHPEQFANPDGGIVILTKKKEIRAVEKAMGRKLAKAGQPASWAQAGIVFQDQYWLILRDAVRFPDQATGTYLRLISAIENGTAVVILPRCGDHLLLVRHFRHATRTWHIEAPRGFGTTALSAEENARKELQEEIGATAQTLISLGPLHPDTGALSDAVELFYAEVASYGRPDSHEGIDALLALSIAEFEALIRDNAITDGFTLAAYTRARLKGLL